MVIYDFLDMIISVISAEICLIRCILLLKMQGVKKMKIAEALAFCGDRGSYFLSQLDLDDHIKEAFIVVLGCCSSLIKKALTKPVHIH